MSKHIIERLRERREQVWQQGHELATHVADQNRNFSDAEQREWDAVSAELDSLDKRIEQVVAQEQRAKSASDAFDGLLGKPASGPRELTGPDADYARAFQSAIKSKNPAPIEIYSESPRYMSQPGIERRDTLKTTATQALRVTVYDRFVERLVENSAVMNAGATVITTSTGEDLVIPRDTAFVGSALTAEGASITETDPTLATSTLKAYKYASFFQISSELVNDTPANLMDYLARGAAQSLALAFGPHLITGTGTGQPSGIVTGATLGTTGPVGTTTSLGAQATAGMGTDILWSLVGSLAEPYVQQRSTAWLMANSTLTTARKLKDSTGQPVLGIGAPTNVGNESLLGLPVFVDPNVAAQSANSKSIVFGDISKYFVRMVNGIRFERSDDYAFQSDLVSFRCIVRLDGTLVDNSAVKYFQSSAT